MNRSSYVVCASESANRLKFVARCTNLHLHYITLHHIYITLHTVLFVRCLIKDVAYTVCLRVVDYLLVSTFLLSFSHDGNRIENASFHNLSINVFP